MGTQGLSGCGVKIRELGRAKSYETRTAKTKVLGLSFYHFPSVRHLGKHCKLSQWGLGQRPGC